MYCSEAALTTQMRKTLFFGAIPSSVRQTSWGLIEAPTLAVASVTWLPFRLCLVIFIEQFEVYHITPYR